MLSVGKVSLGNAYAAHDCCLLCRYYSILGPISFRLFICFLLTSPIALLIKIGVFGVTKSIIYPTCRTKKGRSINVLAGETLMISPFLFISACGPLSAFIFRSICSVYPQLNNYRMLKIIATIIL